MGSQTPQLYVLGLVAIALYYRLTFSQSLDDDPILSINQGKISGVVNYSRGGRKFFSFLGIPYAKPPIGNLRFEPPEKPDSWDGIRDAKEFGPKCIQVDSLLGVMVGQEDCLYLNVFTPFNANHTFERYPVIVYIHGGFFMNGGSDFWKPNYFMDENVVFVSLNYRLAALGFLNTGDEAIRGNMGLKDQSMALAWVQENIEFFGGDPARVTLLGESAGGVCTHLHQYSKMSRGLFNNVISQSGSALHFWAINENPVKQANRLAELTGCASNSTQNIKACLQSLDVENIVQLHTEMLDPLRDPISIYKPSIEIDLDDGNTFLADHPKRMVVFGDFYKVPWITGVNSEEGLVMSAAMLVNKTVWSVAQDNWNYFLQRIIWHYGSEASATLIRNYYLGEDGFTNDSGQPTLEKLMAYTTMISDRGFFVDAHHGILQQSQYSPVYAYYYSYRGDFTVVNFLPEVVGTFSRQLEVSIQLLTTWLSKNVLGRVLPNYGAAHSDELALLFYMPWVSEIYPDSKDYEMSLDLVKLWVDFATDDSQLEFKGVEWPNVNASVQPLKYMHINENPHVVSEPFSLRVEFWDNLLRAEAQNTY